MDIALIGVPFDGGTTNRTGARHGPREIRNQSSLVRRVHHVTGVSPFDLARIADCGDVPVNPLDLRRDAGEHRELLSRMCAAAGAVPLTAGGDHLISLPILRGSRAEGPLGMVHFDAHSDTYDSFFGSRYNHGTPFRRAIEEGLLDPKRVIQIGIRGAISDARNYDFARAAGVRIVFIEEFEERGLAGGDGRGAKDRRRAGRSTSRSTSTSSTPRSRRAPERRRSAASRRAKRRS